ncbi:MAG TPA: hypothetical protein VLI70_05825, partial [Micrococcaceae bacterium]|nr:hypothetical protein [Micrococcaceae bacterium]
MTHESSTPKPSVLVNAARDQHGADAPGMHHPELDLHQDVAALTADLIDIASVSGNETRLADAVERALKS